MILKMLVDLKKRRCHAVAAKIKDVLESHQARTGEEKLDIGGVTEIEHKIKMISGVKPSSFPLISSDWTNHENQATLLDDTCFCNMFLLL